MSYVQSFDPSRHSRELGAMRVHLIMALGEFEPLPKTHETLIEKMREYFDGQKIEVFSKTVAKMGEADFRDFIAETVIASGKYFRDKDGQVKIKE